LIRISVYGIIIATNVAIINKTEAGCNKGGLIVAMRIKGLDEQMIQQYIAEALLILMEKKPYDKITIGEITEKAGVNRSSYYRHFDTKEDIIRFYLKSVMDEYMREYHTLRTKTYRTCWPHRRRAPGRSCASADIRAASVIRES